MSKSIVMRGARPIIAIGVVIVILGIIFHLQGQSVVGPETSFMYSNPDWVSYGTQLVITGFIITAIGIIIIISKRRPHKG